MGSTTPLDEHGQPDYFLNYRHRIDRGIHEMLGIARGMIADGVLSDKEATELRQWAGRNPDLLIHFPGNALYERLQRIFADGKADDSERDDLKAFLESLAGEPERDDELNAHGTSTLPLDRPPPKIDHEGSRFVVTGRFLCGCRELVTQQLTRRGGVISADITKSTDFLLLGSMASRDWKHSAFGRKIQKAVEYRDRGVPIAIVAEDHWVAHLQ